MPDFSISLYNPEMAQDNLIMLMEALEIGPSIKNFETLGEKLSAVVDQDPPWSAKYVYAVYKGYDTVKASPLFTKAIMTLGQLIDNAPPGVAGARFVKLLVFSDDIAEGTLVPKAAQAVVCNNPSCNVRFIKTHPFQAYHDKECQRQWANERKRINRAMFLR